MASSGLRVIGISVVLIFFMSWDAAKARLSPEGENQTAEKVQKMERQPRETDFGSPALVFLREQLQHGDAIIKERLDERYNMVKEQLKDGDSQLKEQLTEGLARLKQQQKEGDDHLKEQLTSDEDLLNSRLAREETRMKEELKGVSQRTTEELARQQHVIDSLKQLVEQWTNKNSAQMDLTQQEVSELKSELNFTKTSLLDTRDKLNLAKNDLRLTQDTLRSTQHDLQATRNDLEATKKTLEIANDKLNTAQIDQTTSRDNARGAVETVKEEMASLKAEVTSLKATMTGGASNTFERYEEPLENGREKLSSSTIGSTYVRWGKASCPANISDLVYSGAVGGSYHAHKGGSPTHLCLSLTPDPDPTGMAVPANLNYLYGAEYEFGPQMEHDLPCAVCRSPGTSNIMVPGAATCPSGWTAHYTGILATGYHDHPHGSDMICLDSSFEARDGGHVNHNGDLFYPVVTMCGSLPCPPYVNNQIVSCVICSL